MVIFEILALDPPIWVSLDIFVSFLGKGMKKYPQKAPEIPLGPLDIQYYFKIFIFLKNLKFQNFKI